MICITIPQSILQNVFSVMADEALGLNLASRSILLFTVKLAVLENIGSPVLIHSDVMTRPIAVATALEKSQYLQTCTW